MQATEEKSQTNPFAFRHQTEWEKNGGEEEEEAYCLAHISTIVSLCMCVCARTNEKESLNQAAKKKKENKKKKQYKL
jgi:hypothetical protein